YMCTLRGKLKLELLAEIPTPGSEGLESGDKVVPRSRSGYCIHAASGRSGLLTHAAVGDRGLPGLVVLR
ncbi:hypothetical protein LLG95_01465, partial [bacterium]|nr:hypothetical protein [bacterium]